MREFTWDEYYGNFYDWAESTQISYMSGLKSFGPADEVCELAQEFADEKLSSRFIRKAVSSGTKFTADQVMELSIFLDRDALGKMAAATSDKFNREQLEELYGVIDDTVFDRLSKKSGIDIDDFDDALPVAKRSVPAKEKPAHRRGFFSSLLLLLGLGALINKPKKAEGPSSRCDGDCAHCPPHYGYRHGRWYYGHGHTEGCQRGGNRGGAGHI